MIKVRKVSRIPHTNFDESFREVERGIRTMIQSRLNLYVRKGSHFSCSKSYKIGSQSEDISKNVNGSMPHFARMGNSASNL